MVTTSGAIEETLRGFTPLGDLLPLRDACIDEPLGDLQLLEEVCNVPTLGELQPFGVICVGESLEDLHPGDIRMGEVLTKFESQEDALTLLDIEDIPT